MALLSFLWLSLLSVALLFSGLASAHNEDPTPDQYCVYSCYSAVDFATFNTSSTDPTEAYYTILCTDTLKIASIYSCAAAYCSKKEIHAGVALIQNTCVWEASINLPAYDTVITQSTDISAIERVSEAVVLEGTVYNNSVIPDADFYKSAYDTTYAYYKNIWLSYDFAYAFYGFWALVVLTGVTNHLGNALWKWNSSPSSNTTLWTWIRRQLILPATFGRSCQEPVGWCTIPPRLESITIAVYVIMNIVFCFPGYVMFSDNLYWTENKQQLSRYFSDRAGHLAIANMPLIWLFATRNSPLLWATGWSFATFNRFHRWVARMATALAVAHGIGYSIYSYFTDYYIQSWADQYFWCGAMAVICMTFILATSVYWLRKNHYELFFNIHIVLAVICTAALFFHVKIFDGMYNGFLWPCVAIWAFDRLLRVARIVFISVIPRVRSRVTAIATYNQDSDTIRIDVTDFLRGKPFIPGTYYYVYAPSAGIIQAYESHPFTLCSWNRQSLPSQVSSPVDSIDFEKSLGAVVRSVPSDEEAASGEAHTFVIRPQAGMTRRLCKKIQSSSEANSSQIPLLLEGPYGSKLDVSGFSDVLIIVGGVGVCEAVTLAHNAIAAGSSVRVAWAVRQRQLVHEICANEFGALMDHPRFQLTVFTTAGVADEMKTEDDKSDTLSYEVRASRPDAMLEMRAARQVCSRNLAVVSCGPDHMADQCRQAAAHLLGESGAPFEYFSQSMGW